jgi:hypothetical protein
MENNERFESCMERKNIEHHRQGIEKTGLHIRQKRCTARQMRVPERYTAGSNLLRQELFHGYKKTVQVPVKERIFRQDGMVEQDECNDADE